MAVANRESFPRGEKSGGDEQDGRGEDEAVIGEEVEQAKNHGAVPGIGSLRAGEEGGVLAETGDLTDGVDDDEEDGAGGEAARRKQFWAGEGGAIG